MILNLLLPLLEKIINHALRYDPVALSKLSRIQKQIIAVDCEDWKMRFYIICESDGLHFEKKISSAANTTLSGTLNHFLHLFIKGADTKSLFEYSIDVEGNTQSIEVLRDIFNHLDLDLEERLSHFLGDALSHQIFFHAKKTKQAMQNIGEKWCQQTKEYIHCETRNVITKKQAEKFYADIATLQNDVERAEVKLNQLGSVKE